MNSEVTTNAEGIELVESKDYVDEKTGAAGRYTRKVYHLESRVPGWVKLLAPSSALKLDEESWDAFPNCKTVITNRFFGERFSLTIESTHFNDDKGDQENALNLDEDQLKKRVVHRVDIGAEQPSDKNEYKESEDPRLFESKNFPEKYGPLTEGWQEKADPHMCCYKVVTILFKIWGVQGKGESFLMDMEGQIFLKFHKEIFCWLDDWYGLSIEEIVAKETQFYEDMGDRLGADDEEEGENGDGEKKKKKKKSKKDKHKDSEVVSPRYHSPEPNGDGEIEEAEVNGASTSNGASSSNGASETTDTSDKEETKKKKKKKDKSAATEAQE